MNARLVAAVVGGINVLFGLAGLLYPERVLGVLGLAVQNAAHTASALGEVRATYGGAFLVLGIYTVVSAGNPYASRGRLTLLGLVWLGAGAARMFGVWMDGNPGLLGWLAVVFELAMGLALVTAAGTAMPAASAGLPASPPATS